MGKFKNVSQVRSRSKVVDLDRFDNDIKVLVKRMETWSKNVRVDSQKVLRPAAEPLIQEIQRRMPVFPRRHFRYKTGGGQIVATYYPGNLRRSIRDLNLKNTNAVFVGARLTGFAGGTFSGARTDGWYAHIVERGAPAIGIRPQRPIAKGTRAAIPRIEAIIRRRLIQRLKTL